MSRTEFINAKWTNESRRLEWTIRCEYIEVLNKTMSDWVLESGQKLQHEKLWIWTHSLFFMVLSKIQNIYLGTLFYSIYFGSFCDYRFQVSSLWWVHSAFGRLAVGRLEVETSEILIYAHWRAWAPALQRTWTSISYLLTDARNFPWPSWNL